MYDALREPAVEGWSTASYDASAWKPAHEVALEGHISKAGNPNMPWVNDYSGFELIGQFGQTVKQINELTALSVEEVRPGVFVYDMGQIHQCHIGTQTRRDNFLLLKEPVSHLFHRLAELPISSKPNIIAHQRHIRVSRLTDMSFQSNLMSRFPGRCIIDAVLHPSTAGSLKASYTSP